VTVTKEGKQAFDKCSERVDVFLADIFRDFTTEDIETLWTLLKKLYGFDGAGYDSFEGHPGHNADIVLKYHPNYLKRRNER
jgi:hypothetical protein